MNLIPLDDNDDEEFLSYAEKLTTGALSLYKPQSLYVVKLDNWFGEKWLAFSHKTLGALGIHSDDLVIPPFKPSRVLCEKHYKISAGIPTEAEFSESIHKNQTSSDNQKRKISTLFPNTAFSWISGNTKHNNRGSIMFYVPTENTHSTSYIGFAKTSEWSLSKVKGIGASELDHILGAEPANTG